MKIGLSLHQNLAASGREEQIRLLENDILSAQRGDWTSKEKLARAFLPLLSSLVDKRTQDATRKNSYMEAGKQGLFEAARKYKRSLGPARFHVFALDFIEKSMTRVDHPDGFFARLFRR